MKSFLNFLSEAKMSKAAAQAAKMGLRSDGHGGWYDQRGEFVAKTEKDRLVFFNSNQNPDGRDPNQSEQDKKLSGREAAGGAALNAGPTIGAALPASACACSMVYGPLATRR